MKGTGKVENYRITPEMKVTLKEYKKLNQARQAVQARMAQLQAEGRGLGMMMKEITGQLNMLMQQAPETPVRELIGQEPAAR